MGDTLLLALHRRDIRARAQLAVGRVQVGDVVLQAVVLIVLLRLLTDDPRALTLVTVVDTGVRAVGQDRLGPFTLSHTGLNISGEFSGPFNGVVGRYRNANIS